MQLPPPLAGAHECGLPLDRCDRSRGQDFRLALPDRPVIDGRPRVVDACDDDARRVVLRRGPRPLHGPRRLWRRQFLRNGDWRHGGLGQHLDGSGLYRRQRFRQHLFHH